MTDLRQEAEKRLASLKEQGVVREIRTSHAQIEQVTTPQIHVFVDGGEHGIQARQREITHLLEDLGARIDVKPSTP